MKEFTIPQLEQISHALGVDFYKSAMSHKLKDKRLPMNFYRNRFQSSHDYVFEELILMGFAEKGKFQELEFYFVNEKGIEQYRSQFAKLIRYVKPNDRDLEYLKCRINLYCDIYYYRFCDDNSEHVISAYLHYYVKKWGVSHTTSDVINKFKTELKNYNKRGLLN